MVKIPKEVQEIMDAFAAPFDISDIEFVGIGGGSGQVIAAPYITNRGIMNRLDSVVGIARWKNEFKQSPNGGVLCGISVFIGGEWLTKWDGADNTRIESVKGGLSGAMKRAAVQWGIGRFLYDAPQMWVVGETYTKGGKQHVRLGKAGEQQARTLMKKWLDTITRPYPVNTLIHKLQSVEKTNRYRDIANIQASKLVSAALAEKIFGKEYAYTNGAVYAINKWMAGGDYSRLELDSLYEYFGIDKPSTTGKNDEQSDNSTGTQVQA